MSKEPAIEVRAASPADPAIAALIALHVGNMHETTPVEHAYALDPAGLAAPGISLFGAYRGGALAGIGALADVAGDPRHAELKSMRTHPGHLRQGVAQAILDHLLAVARARGLERVSLETGTGPEFVPAVALYERAGFTACEAFGDYTPSEYNRFLTLRLR